MNMNMNTSTVTNYTPQKKSITDHVSETASKAWSGFTGMFKQPSVSPAAPSSPVAPAPAPAPAPSSTMGGKKRRTIRAKARAMKGGKSKKHGKKHGKSKKGKKSGKSTKKRSYKKRSYKKH